MKELEYIRYELSEDGDILTFANDGNREFELVGNYHHDYEVLSYKGADYKIGCIKNGEVIMDELFKSDNDVGVHENGRSMNKYSTDFNDGKSTLVCILLIIGLSLMIFPMFLE